MPPFPMAVAASLPPAPEPLFVAPLTPASSETATRVYDADRQLIAIFYGPHHAAQAAWFITEADGEFGFEVPSDQEGVA